MVASLEEEYDVLQEDPDVARIRWSIALRVSSISRGQQTPGPGRAETGISLC